MSTIRNVTVVGTGVLGSQIAFQAAFHGYAVTAYDISDEVMEKAKSGFARLAELYKADGVAGAVDGKADATISNIRLASALDDAVAEGRPGDRVGSRKPRSETRGLHHAR